MAIVPGMRGRRSVEAVVVLGALGFALVACVAERQGVVTETVVAETGTSDAEVSLASSSSTSTSGFPTETWATVSTAPPPPRPTTCGTVLDPDGEVSTVVITSGSPTCPDAEALVASYYEEWVAGPPDQPVVIDGWECTTGDEDDPGPLATCALSGFGTVTAGP